MRGFLMELIMCKQCGDCTKQHEYSMDDAIDNYLDLNL